MPVIELRALTPDDWPAWRELRLAAMAEAPHAFGSRLADWQGDGDREQRWRDRLGHCRVLQRHRGSRRPAGRDGQPTGMASGVPADGENGAAELISMWVSPVARGRGVSDRLVRAAVDWPGCLPRHQNLVRVPA